ncbi:MAG: hydroxyethylthiazole kinase [Sulfobacillus acidophilus]|uniref:Hydroxyethylthiazole kinase n=1 Tax=Sulfobacillus acidophilus TaxID=53633 RepID=A0A2T2WMD5_9FIRM|nr:MAG: hydroxyethylthiazole kinase [Sulfobacillus acidophilus]
MALDVGRWLKLVRCNRPLIHNMTNLVVTNVVANALLALGASPVMAYAHEEVEEMAKLAGAVALNMGTLTPDLVAGMILAGRAAAEAQIPVVFDPVGVGATQYRQQAAQEILAQVPLSVLKGNGGEISHMVGVGGSVRGVDAQTVGSGLREAMAEYARAHQLVVVATGAEDLVTDGQTVWVLSNGDVRLSEITGSGCMVTALIAAFLAICDAPCQLAQMAEASVAAITCFNVAAETAARMAQGPGTFVPQLFDALKALTPEDVNRRARLKDTVA